MFQTITFYLTTPYSFAQKNSTLFISIARYRPIYL